MKKVKIIEWNETLMMDSFGDCDKETCEQITDLYVNIVTTKYPDAEINIELVNAVGTSIGNNQLVWTDGSETEVHPYGEKLFQKALESI